MRFRTDCPVHIVMLGCGGTGGHIAPHLYRLLHALFRRIRHGNLLFGPLRRE